VFKVTILRSGFFGTSTTWYQLDQRRHLRICCVKSTVHIPCIYCFHSGGFGLASFFSCLAASSRCGHTHDQRTAVRGLGRAHYSVTSSRTISVRLSLVHDREGFELHSLTKSSNPSKVPVNSRSLFMITHIREPMHLSINSGAW
jgi:hypothetical protein